MKKKPRGVLRYPADPDYSKLGRFAMLTQYPAAAPAPANTGTLMVVAGAASGITIAPTTEYLNVGGKVNSAIGSLPGQVNYRTTRAGNIQNFRVFVTANPLGAPSTLTLLINGAPTALSTVIGAGFTGSIDVAGTAPVTEDDLVAVEIARPAGGQLELTATYDMPGAAGQTTAMVHGAWTVDPATFTALAIGTGYNGFFDSQGGSAVAAEANARYRATHAGTFRRFKVRVPINGFGGPLPVTLRINGADTALTVSVPAGSTAPVSIDVPVPVAAGDLVSVVANGTGIRAGFTTAAVAVYDYI